MNNRRDLPATEKQVLLNFLNTSTHQNNCTTIALNQIYFADKLRKKTFLAANPKLNIDYDKNSKTSTSKFIEVLVKKGYNKTK